MADITVEAVMNKIPSEMIFDWDQTALHYVPTGEWTMHRTGETVIPIANSDDKCQITGVFAATLSGKYVSPAQIYLQRQNRALQPPSNISKGMGHLAQQQPLVK